MFTSSLFLFGTLCVALVPPMVQGSYWNVCRALDQIKAGLERKAIIFGCVVDCGEPPAIENKNYPTSPAPSTTLDSEVTYSCDDGFSATGGTGTSTCQADGTWSTPTLTCALTTRPCPTSDGFILEDDGVDAFCYKMVADFQRYDGAFAECATFESGRLATLNTPRRIAIIRANQMETVATNPDSSIHLVGIQRDQDDGVLYWSNGDPVDLATISDTGADCGLLNVRKDLFENGICTAFAYFVCEIDLII